MTPHASTETSWTGTPAIVITHRQTLRENVRSGVNTESMIQHDGEKTRRGNTGVHILRLTPKVNDPANFFARLASAIESEDRQAEARHKTSDTTEERSYETKNGLKCYRFSGRHVSGYPAWLEVREHGAYGRYISCPNVNVGIRIQREKPCESGRHEWSRLTMRDWYCKTCGVVENSNHVLTNATKSS
jgi:hypothetical protein